MALGEGGGLFMSIQTNQTVFGQFRSQNELKIVPGDKASSENPLAADPC